MSIGIADPATLNDVVETVEEVRGVEATDVLDPERSHTDDWLLEVTVRGPDGRVPPRIMEAIGEAGGGSRAIRPQGSEYFVVEVL